MANNFTELTEYLSEKFEGIDKRFDELQSGFGNLQTSVDNYALKADNYHKEMSVLIHKVNRMEEWAKKVSAKLGIELNF